jgi:hypothetical protein
MMKRRKENDRKEQSVLEVDTGEVKVEMAVGIGEQEVEMKRQLFS